MCGIRLYRPVYECSSLTSLVDKTSDSPVVSPQLNQTDASPTYNKQTNNNCNYDKFTLTALFG